MSRVERRIGWPKNVRHTSGILFFDDVDEAEEKEGGEEVEHPVSAEGMASATREELEDGIAGEAEAEAVGDGPGEWDGCDGKEGGDADLGVVPLDSAEAGEHEAADEDERRGGGEAGDGSDEWGDKERDQEEDAGDDCGDAGTASGGDSGGGFDVTGDRAGTGEGTDDGGGGVGEEDAVEARDGMCFGTGPVDEASAVGDGDKSADVVEEIDKEEYKDDFERADVKGGANVEMKGGGFDR